MSITLAVVSVCQSSSENCTFRLEAERAVSPITPNIDMNFLSFPFEGILNWWVQVKFVPSSCQLLVALLRRFSVCWFVPVPRNHSPLLTGVKTVLCHSNQSFHAGKNTNHRCVAAVVASSAKAMPSCPEKT